MLLMRCVLSTNSTSRLSARKAHSNEAAHRLELRNHERTHKIVNLKQVP
jgi:hypothetical protein